MTGRWCRFASWPEANIYELNRGKGPDVPIRRRGNYGVGWNTREAYIQLSAEPINNRAANFNRPLKDCLVNAGPTALRAPSDDALFEEAVPSGCGG